MSIEPLEERTKAIRAFNRFYTKQVGALNEGLLESPHSLIEARVIYELANRDRPTAAAVAKDLDLDPAYLSRILRKLKLRGLVESRRSESDGRAQILTLSLDGRNTFATLDRASRSEVGEILESLSDAEQRRLLDSMASIQDLLGSERTSPEPTIIRSHRPGDIGWIVHRQATLYWQEYGWDSTFEGLIAEIAGQFLNDHDPKREHCWVAEQGGKIVGSVFLVRVDDELAKLRLLYVEPAARGSGLGRRLVEECLNFARACGYRRMTFWTNANLTAARKIYQSIGFELVAEEPHHSFGHDLIGQNWELEL